MSICVFCKEPLSESGRAKEHIVPRWLQIEWNLSNETIQPTHHSPEFEVISQRNHNYNSFLAGHVCAACNNGWMSQLESDCKQLILDLALGKRRVLEISNEEALLLARWTCKTAFSLHTSANWRKVVPDDHIYTLESDEYRLPENVFVVAHTYKSDKTFGWTQTTTWPIYIGDNELTDECANHVKETGYKIGLRIGGFYTMVFYNPLTFARPCLWKFRHVPLYPRWSHPVAWQISDRAWPSKQEYRFQLFVNALSLSINESEQGAAANP